MYSKSRSGQLNLVPQKYPKPPIIEAVLHVRYSSPMTDGELKRIPRLLQSEFPKSKEESEFQLKVRLEKGQPTGTPEPSVVDQGARLLSDNDQRVVVSRRAAVLFSYHAPYPDWEAFVTSAHFVFDTLRDKLGYKPISSIGLRYVNRLDIPFTGNESLMVPSDYLLVGVTLPENGITDTVRMFTGLVEVDIKHDRLIGRIQAATAGSALIEHASLLFDIDVIAQFDVPSKADEFWALVGRMRDAKNAIFESAVTDKARQLFGWTP